MYNYPYVFLPIHPSIRRRTSACSPLASWTLDVRCSSVLFFLFTGSYLLVTVYHLLVTIHYSSFDPFPALHGVAWVAYFQGHDKTDSFSLILCNHSLPSLPKLQFLLLDWKKKSKPAHNCHPTLYNLPSGRSNPA